MDNCNTQLLDVPSPTTEEMTSLYSEIISHYLTQDEKSSSILCLSIKATMAQFLQHTHALLHGFKNKNNKVTMKNVHESQISALRQCVVDLCDSSKQWENFPGAQQ